MLNLRPGVKVKLRDGSVRGPLRDRRSENDKWPWGERCETCGQERHDGMVWKPDGRSGKRVRGFPHECMDYDSRDPLPDDIVEVID